MEITVRNLQKKIPVYPKRTKELVLRLLKGEGVKKGDISVSFVSDREISKLNLKYLNENRPTDVLAFGLAGGNKKISGDIIISAETAARNSRIYKTTPIYELDLYSAHGCLHLLGYNDNSPKNTKIMREKESKYAKFTPTGSVKCQSIKPKR
ncbi:MAG: rRNA maturation RNase YbeY [Candidatus Omnitrophota bacterium]